MATHSSILVGKIPLSEEPGRIQSTKDHNMTLRLNNNKSTYHVLSTV